MLSGGLVNTILVPVITKGPTLTLVFMSNSSLVSISDQVDFQLKFNIYLTDDFVTTIPILFTSKR